jgi:hypothetical protein
MKTDKNFIHFQNMKSTKFFFFSLSNQASVLSSQGFLFWLAVAGACEEKPKAE